jgi:adenine-specific DNA-methyltransferase
MTDSPNRYSGTLELTWTNKHLRLLAEEDGAYQWVAPSDYRVAEVRLLDEAGAVGETRSRAERAKDNLLIRGDALNALTSLGELPEFADELVGKVRLAYLDPPFNTQQSFLHYDDNLEHSVWLTMMRDRLVQIRRLLANNGSVWVHLDDREAHRCRSVLDEVFGIDCFVSEVVWEITDARKMDAKQFSLAHNRLLIYSREPGWEPDRYPGDADEASYPHTAPDGRRYSRRELRKWGKNSLRRDRPNLWYSITAPNGEDVWPVRPDGKEGRWRWQLSKVEEEWDRIDWVHTDRGVEPYVMTFVEEGKKPKPPRTLWTTDWMPGNPAAREHLKQLFPGLEPFDTPKPEELLGEILFLATCPADIVLDCFLGSGTTAGVAHKMGRRWIGIERSTDTLDTYALPRLTKVVDDEDSGGITKRAEWAGGGGFRVLDVAPSMFDEDEGTVYLAEWATNGRLAEACAAQLHYEFEPEPPFAGRRGRTRLAVVDGLVNEDVVRLLVANLPEDERLVVCGTAVDPAARAVLRELRRGSSVRKIPASILQDYRQTRWVPRSTVPQPGPNGSVTAANEALGAPTEAR